MRHHLTNNNFQTIFDGINTSLRMLQRAAIIDMGTNTFHLVMFEWEGNRYKILDKLQIPVKLGRGGFKDKIITPEAYERGIEAMSEIKQLLIKHDVSYAEAFGTSALRNAKNASEFLKDAERILSFPVKVINGAEEAEWIYNGVRKAVPLGDEAHLIMDIGGGSVEFIIADGQHISWKKSYEIGIARLIERFNASDPMTEEDIRNIELYLEDELKQLWVKCAKYQIKSLVGASGSFESLASIEMELFHSKTQEAAFLHHILNMSHFRDIYMKIIGASRKELEELPGLPNFRLEMITAAVIMINYVLKRLKISRIIVSDYALKEGIMFSIMSKSEVDWQLSN